MSTYQDFVNLPPGALIKFARAYQIMPPDALNTTALIAFADTLAVVQSNKLAMDEQLINVLPDSVHLRNECMQRLGREDFNVGPEGESLQEDCPFDAV